MIEVRPNKISYLLFAIVILLLVMNVIFTYRNNDIIEENKILQKQAEGVKVDLLEVMNQSIRGLDVGLRGFALTNKESFVVPMYEGRDVLDSLLSQIEYALMVQKYDMDSFSELKDSLKSYVNFTFQLKNLLDVGRRHEFDSLLRTDRGLTLFHQFNSFSIKVHAFEDQIMHEAQVKYETALENNNLLQLLLLIFCVPSLLLSAYFIHTLMIVTKKLSDTEKQKAEIIRHRNEVLEIKVEERTKELDQKNIELHDVQIEIAKQNEGLEEMVHQRTSELMFTNREIAGQLRQLKEIGFILAHNLRKPVANILGMLNIIVMEAGGEKSELLPILVDSTEELDDIVIDMNKIIEIKSSDVNTLVLEDINFEEVVLEITGVLGTEIKDTGTSIEYDFGELSGVISFRTYIHNMIYHLLSNSIKYRHPDRKPIIKLSTKRQGEFICLCVKDNGVGIDMDKYGNGLFKLYNRFHNHVEGRGLGLYLIKAQLTSLGGKVEVESIVDEGSCFSLYFKI